MERRVLYQPAFSSLAKEQLAVGSWLLATGSWLLAIGSRLPISLTRE
jgi:hypothetical protein